MATNDFLPFAAAGGANVLAQADWLALAARLSGYTAGVANSAQINKGLRQAAAVAAAFGQFLNDYGTLDALDDGNIGNLVRDFARSIQAGKFSFAVATGTANAWTVAPTPALAAYAAGRVLNIVAPATNTSTTVNMNVSGLGNRRIKKVDGSDPAIGDLVAGVAYPTVDDGTNIRILSVLASDIRALLLPSGTQTLYVRTDGNDANDGSANSAGSAMATVNAAVARATSLYSLAGRSITIRLGNAGTYAPFLISNSAGQITILGDTANQDSYIIQGSTPGFVAGANVQLRGVQLYNSATTNNTLEAAYGGAVDCANVTFSGSGGGTGTAHALSSPGGSITFSGPVKFQSNQAIMIFGNGGPVTIQSGITVTFSGAPTVSVATAAARGGSGYIRASGATMTGSVTGPRYSTALNGVIDTGGAGANFFPGSSAGVISTGGQYA